MNIAHVLARKGGHVHTIQPEKTVREALALLAHHNVGALVVVEQVDRPIGILSERDIVRKAAQDEQLYGRLVLDLMTKNIIVGSPEDDLRVVAHTMTEKRIRHLPVVVQGRLVGIISIGDVVKAQRDQYEGEIETLQIQISSDGL